MADEKRTRKVFISFLGTNLYQECKYAYPDDSGKFSESVRFIQEATLEYLVSKDEWTKDDYVYIVLTEDSKTNNWNDGHTFKFDFKDSNGNDHKREDKQEEGLFQRLKDFKDDNALNFHIEPILLKDDEKDEKEKMWKIFEKVFSVIKDKDWLYIDVTHGYRYLPMFLLILCNYSKFLKKVKVKSITYGNFEDKKDGVAPIVDLLPLTKLQDWTYAAGQYLDSGNVNKLVQLSSNKYADFASKLKDTISDFHACRGISIIESKNLSEIKSIMSSLDTSEVPPLKFVFDEIKTDFDKFENVQNVKNGYESAKWCYKNQLYQQAITILIETVITDICVYEKLDWKVRKNRDIASNALYIVAKNIQETGWKIVTDTEDKDKYNADYLTMFQNNSDSLINIEESVKYRSKYYRELMLYRQLVASQRVKELVELSTMIKDVRDDIDHAGMRKNARSFVDFESGLEKDFAKLDEVLSLYPPPAMNANPVKI